jgi:hypothetical protein
MAIDAKLPIPCQWIATGWFHGRMAMKSDSSDTLTHRFKYNKPVNFVRRIEYIGQNRLVETQHHVAIST